MTRHHTTRQEVDVLLSLAHAVELPKSAIKDGNDFAVIYEYQEGDEEGLIVAARTLDGARRDLCGSVHYQKKG